MSPAVIVMKKELKEMLRDRRIRNNALIMPMLMMMLMLSFFGFIMGVGEKKNQIIHVVDANNSLIQKLKADQIQVVQIPSLEEGQKLIRSGKARVVLQFEPDFDSKIEAKEPTQIQAYIDPQQETGKIALASVQEDLAKINAAAASAVLQAHNVNPESLMPATIHENEIKVGSSETNGFLVGLLPYLIVVYAFYGGFGSGSDIVAGEKEKYTLETLLIAPVGRTQIAVGKFLSLATICFLSSFSALMGVVIAGSSHLPMYAKVFPHGLGLNGGQFATIILVLIPTVALFASILIAVSAWAKNTREAQSHLALISLVVLIPAIFGQVIGLTDLASNWWIRLVPVLNTSVTLRDALQGKTNAMGVFLTAAVGIALAAAGIRIAVHLFKREEVLTRV